MAACCPSKLSAASRGFWQQCTCAVLGGLLCSSCCIVQLLLNSFSVGCAGFAVLTPYRPAFLSLTAVTLAGNYIKYRNKRRTALALAVAFGLAVTPEVVQLYNENKLYHWAPILTGLRAEEKRACTETERIQVRVEDMKCLACCARVKNHVLATTSAQSCEVDFEAGLVRAQGPNLSAATMVLAIQSLGYKTEAAKSDCIELQANSRQTLQ